jgi:nucleolar protein 14
VSRQQDDDLRHELDNELDSIRGLLFAEDTSTLIPLEAATLRNKPPELPVSDPSSSAGDTAILRPPNATRDQAFDQYVRELAFDKRAKPKDRAKTEEELALEEKERLEKAERRRVRRMEGLDDYDSEEEGTQKLKRAQHRGGDDLEDDFMNDGELAGLGKGLTEDDASDNEEGVDVEGSEGETDEDEAEAEGEGSSEDNSEGDEEGAEEENMEDENFDVEEGEHEDLVTSRRKPSKKPLDKELPYTFDCPESHDDFLEITEGIKDSDIPTVIQRVRVLHHPSLAENNKFKLQALTNVLVDHILYVTSPPSPRFGVVSGLLPHLAALTRAYPTTSATHFVSKLKLMEKNLKRGLSQGALNLETKTFPGLPELAILRTIGTLWSTSDMNHVVVSPARLLMAAYLGLGRVRSVQDLASGLFLCTIWLQYESLSSRFVPEAVNFALNAVIHLSPHKYVQPKDVPGSFPHPDVGSDLAKLLRINLKKVSVASLSSPIDVVAIFTDTEEEETTKAQLLSTALDILGRFAEMYKSLDGFPELFTPILEVIKGLGIRKLPEPLQVRSMYFHFSAMY